MLTCKPTVILRRASSFFPVLKLIGNFTVKLDCEPLPYALPGEKRYPQLVMMAELNNYERTVKLRS